MARGGYIPDYSDPSYNKQVAVPSLNAAAEPEGVEVLPNRVSDSEREQVVQWILRAQADGRLDGHQADIRVGHARVAKTQAQLGALIRDLPTPPAVKQRKSVRQRLGSAHPLVAASCLFLGFAGVCLIVVPWVLMDNRTHPAQVLYAFASVCTIAGLGVIVGALIWAGKAFSWG